ncbi:uncharacterized protein CMU_013530 [Cryptosporidium muris RN66]|uniref:Uncharacterized protein n=1 Tax=Cryptosporidium muris (strain RN66) TaxID=441375 RepID=B6AER1_CRYMR|nr:uncharacterized protein CMU_013530 [Cryptosporidium muris RN66]EEA06678.1 hypothetical protein, conserved [Cryptosporidium muris RN66]|eukprot:XP_002141027.1 hypothetical protein [Cryptosporidium muris RN66]
MFISARWAIISLLIAFDIYCQAVWLGCHVENGVSLDIRQQRRLYMVKSSDCPPNHPYIRSVFHSDLFRSIFDLEDVGQALYISLSTAPELRSFLLSFASMFAVAERVFVLFIALHIIFYFLVAPILRLFVILLTLLLIIRTIYALYNFWGSSDLYSSVYQMWIMFQNFMNGVDSRILNYMEDVLHYIGISPIYRGS